MHQSFNRRTATKVKDGRVQRKNRHIPTGKLGFVLDRESPPPGYRHVLKKEHVQNFILLIPDWDRLAENLERIVLSGDNSNGDGYYEFYHREKTSSIFLHAWPEEEYAERFAMRHFRQMLPWYKDSFGDPRMGDQRK